MTLNMGPQHPSTHGVLRVALELDGETVVRARPIVGYLHTGMEKQAEYKTYTQSIPQTDRMDYLAPMSNNLAFCLAAEKLLGIEAPPRAQAARVLLTELTRISAHCVWLGTHALDIGAMTVFFYCFREREKVLSIYDHVCGARMTASYFRVGGLARDLPGEDFIARCRTFVDEMPAHVDEYESLLTNNPIWLARTKGVAPLSAAQAIALGATGPTLRGSGVRWDLRKDMPYSGYDGYDFDVPVGAHGDAFDRYQVRVEEIRQSTRIADQALKQLEALGPGDYRLRDYKYVLPPKEDVRTSMEALIHHFKIVAHGFFPPEGEAYHAIEAPKGELGFYFISDGTPKPWRMKVRSPSFVNLQTLPTMVEGRLVADVIAAIGSLDIVLGEIDR
ncbi:MAG TPA: NADH dehydrogenase (quinone) subunit D [Candidatus Eisenbacteria bacterium]|nr:NADH dehydrogenase (quinone) subunit D [Candidatus Eisenbacteria bacterium]